MLYVNDGARRQDTFEFVDQRDEDCRFFSQRSTSRMAIPNTPVQSLTPLKKFKYQEVWQRAFIKIKAKSSMNRLGKELQLFGASTIGDDRIADATQADDLFKKMKKSIEVVEVKSKPRFLLLPDNPVKYLWTLVYFFLMVYTAFVMPFRLAFYDDVSHDSWFIVDNVINGLFFLDIILTLNSAYYDGEGGLVTSRWKIFLAYLRSWLIIDLVACVPFSVFDTSTSISGSSSSQVNGLLRLLRIPRVYRLLRLTRVLKMLNRYNQWHCFERFQELVNAKQSTIRLVIFMLTVVIGLHLMSCLWYLVPQLEGMTIDTWAVVHSLQDFPVADQYINSLYWAVTTLATVGYGDIVPTTSTEKILAIIWMAFGVCFFSFTVSSLSSMLNSVDTKDSLLENKLAAIEEFSDESQLTKELRLRLKHALRYSTTHTGFSSQVKRGIFTELPRALRYEVALAMHHGAVKRIPFFMDQDQAFIAAIVPFLNSQQVSEQAQVYQEGDYADEVYFIVQGTCAVMFHDLVMKKLQRGAYFGEVEVMFTIQRKNTIQAIAQTDLLSMHKKLLGLIQADFPNIYENMREIAETRDVLNDKTKARFEKIFSEMARNKSIPKPKKKMQKATSLVSTASKSTISCTEERLDDLEENVREIRKMVTSLYDASQEIKKEAVPEQRTEVRHKTYPTPSTANLCDVCEEED